MRVVLLAIGSWSLVGCRAIVDRTSYHECQREGYAEHFALGSTMETLFERCWRLDNTDDGVYNVFIYDDDLVIRVADASAGKLEQWAGDDQAPMVYQDFEKNFVAAVRVEPVDKIDGSHCLEPGNTAGLVARQDGEWATLMVAPMAGDFMCADAAENPPPAFAALRTRNGAWGADADELGPGGMGIGPDVEGDIAVCRISNTLTYWYRNPASETSTDEDWIQLTEDGVAPLQHSVASGPMQIGLTAAGTAGAFEVEGHFQFAFLTDSVRPDGCPATLGALGVPPLD